MPGGSNLSKPHLRRAFEARRLFDRRCCRWLRQRHSAHIVQAGAAKHPQCADLHDENDGPGFWRRSHQYINDAKNSVWVVSRSFRLDRSTLPPSEGNATLSSNWECYRRAAADPMQDADIRVHAFVGNRNRTRRTSARGSESSHAMPRPVGGLHHRVGTLLEADETDQRRLTGSLRPRAAGKSRFLGNRD